MDQGYSVTKYLTIYMADLSNNPKQCLKHHLQIAPKIAPKIVPKIVLRNAKKSHQRHRPKYRPQNCPKTCPKKVVLFRVIQILSVCSLGERPTH